jgi:Holliday junction DNA helicase RuvA
MIASITGKLKRKGADYLIVDVSGIGYQVSVPLSTFCNIPEPGADLSLHIHTHLREDSLSLFGFLTQPEKDMFQMLLGVSGIGPKLALAVLSSLPVPELSCALQSSDDSRLCSIPGIGKKTAARMVLELKDKIRVVLPDAVAPRSVDNRDRLDDVVSALVNLGYKRAQAEDAVNKVNRQKAGIALEDLIREALSLLLNK